jgi:RNAse (barnase) inhibitor barstar
MATDSAALPVLVVDGANFSDLDGFAREFSRLLRDYTWRGNLDAFHDILRGGFGTPEDGWLLRWLNSDLSRAALGTLFDQIIEIIRDHGVGGDESEDGIVLELR